MIYEQFSLVMNNRNMVINVAIIGAGPAGLCCAKNSIDAGCNVIVYEQNATIGGQWAYTESSENDGTPNHSSIYKGLRTNVPVECMGFFNYPFKKKRRSFVAHEEVLAFYQSYASDFNLNNVIKFQSYVTHVRPLSMNRWEILSRDLIENRYEYKTFDVIFLCNGHYSEPSIPNIDGLNAFHGHKTHSHNYRRPDEYRNKVVLIVGAGPSGRDIVYEISTEAKHILWSHHRDLKGIKLPSNVEQFGDIKSFKKNSVEFMDKSEHNITNVLFCTGFRYSFPFLSTDCGLNVIDKFMVEPLFKHMINIRFPTMAIIGLQTCAYSFIYDLQVRLCLKYFKNEIKLPTKEKMFEDFHNEKERRKEMGMDIRKAHLLGGTDQRDYIKVLSESVQTVKMHEVLLDIYDDCSELRIKYPNSYREFNYTIVNDEIFLRNHISD